MIVMPITIPRSLLAPLREEVLRHHPGRQSMEEVVLSMQQRAAKEQATQLAQCASSTNSECKPKTPTEGTFWCHFCLMASFAMTYAGTAIHWVDWEHSGHLQFGVHMPYELGFAVKPKDSDQYTEQAARLLIESLCR